MCLLGCSGFAFLRKNAKKSSVICMLFYFHLFPSMGLSVPLFMPLFSIAFLVLSLPIQILPFVFLVFFSFLSSSISHPPLWLSFFLVRKKEKKKNSWWRFVYGEWNVPERANTALRLKLNPRCYPWVELMAVSSLVRSWGDSLSVVWWYTEQGGSHREGDWILGRDKLCVSVVMRLRVKGDVFIW